VHCVRKRGTIPDLVAKRKTSPKKRPARTAPKKTPPPPPPKKSVFEALGPATEHLFRAAGELAAAASAAVDALPKPGERPKQIVEGGKRALSMLGEAAAAGARFARKQAKERIRREALEEIVAGLDRQAERLKGPAAAALETVREAVRGAAGAVRESARPEPSNPTPKTRDRKRAVARDAIQRELDSLDESREEE
jgi:hypothetical protein